VGDQLAIVPGETLDGEGYWFEDIDGDRAYEIVSVDNGFLYAFAPYAFSFAPRHVVRLVGNKIIDVRGDPSFFPYFQQEVFRMEHLAELDTTLWSSNGFLAAWVAAKAIVGEFEDAWGRMLSLYDRNSDWPLTTCESALVDGLCPQGFERTLSFPEALRRHLAESGYIPQEDPAEDEEQPLAKEISPSPEESSSPADATVAAVRPELPPPIEQGPKTASSGTGFFVSSEGHLITNAHVVESCGQVTIKLPSDETYSARVMARDVANDLALLKTHASSAPAKIRLSARLGERVFAFGFPLSTLLASSGNFTEGSVTAVAGIRDDSRFLQISAPVQPGNSGGPLLDASGNVIGVVTGKLNALLAYAAIGDLPQNVNFALKASTLIAFLETHGVATRHSTGNEAKLAPEDVADKANDISALVRCN
jgi:S1-C subfamily serine protease